MHAPAPGSVHYLAGARGFNQGLNKMRTDKKTYDAVAKVLNALFKTHGEKANSAINRYIRIRREKKQNRKRIEELQSELKELNKG